MTTGPLSGIRILDLAIAATGPYAATLLADQGAEVIKVERPAIGDIARWVHCPISVNWHRSEESRGNGAMQSAAAMHRRVSPLGSREELPRMS